MKGTTSSILCVTLPLVLCVGVIVATVRARAPFNEVDSACWNCCLPAACAMATGNDQGAIIGAMHGPKEEYTLRDAQTYLLGQGIYADLNKAAAIIITKTPYEGLVHAIYWDGAAAYDPDPDTVGPIDLSQYTVLQIIPLSKSAKRTAWSIWRH